MTLNLVYYIYLLNNTASQRLGKSLLDFTLDLCESIWEDDNFNDQ